ncbi:universal stress protein F [Salmonella enterica subsp. enterica serovar Kentucky str. ATCC 9263]|nr:universal stress protein F [Salmonella enterica subsp. enterica serovar Kentucky str. ATCC 9263]
MNRTILVPIDISDSELTQRVISHVEAEAKIDDAKVHFLTVIPSLPYYASLGLAYSAELPAMDDLKAEAKSQLEAIIKKFNLPADRVQAHVAEGSPKIRFWKWTKITGRYGDYRLASSGYYYLSVGFQRRSRCASCGMLRTGGALNTRARIRECGLKSTIIIA